MSNLGIYLSMNIFFILVGIGVIIYEFVTKAKEYIPKAIFCLICIAFLIYNSTPAFKDVIEQETTTVIAEYVRYQNGSIAMRNLYFIGDMGEISLEAPAAARIVPKLSEGKTYEVEYYNNSKLIKGFKLID